MNWLNWPNRITIARIILVAPYVVCLLYLRDHDNWRYAALVLFALMAISDALDGYLARRLGEETAIGRFLDPLGDKMLITASVIILAVESTAIDGYRIPVWVAVCAIAKDVLTVAGFAIVYATTSEYFIYPRILGKACTLVQCLVVGFCLAGPNLPTGATGTWQVLYVVASAMAVLATADYLLLGSRFAGQWHLRHAEGKQPSQENKNE